MDFFQANIHLDEVLIQVLAFLIVFWVLKAFAWKPILRLLESRQKKIASEFDAIEQVKKEVAALRADYDKKLSKIEEEAHVKMQEMIREGKKISREIQDSARNQAKEILEKSKEDILLETAKARVILRQEIAGLVSAATERLIHEKLSGKEDEEMILKFIKEIDQEGATR